MDSGLNLDDLLSKYPVEQLAISRVLIRQGSKKGLLQKNSFELPNIRSPHPENIFLRFFSQLMFKRKVIQEIESFKPDLLFFHFGQTAANFIKSTRRFGKPFVVALYGHDISVAIRSRRWRNKYKQFSSTNGGFLVLAEDVRRRVLNMGISDSQILTYNYPINIEPYLKVNKHHQGEQFRITIPGRLVEKKGHIFLFEAVKLLRDRGMSIHLTVIGYGDATNYLKKAQEIGIQDWIEWVDTSTATIKGDFDQIYIHVLSATDLVVLPCTTSNQGDNEAGPALVLCFAQAAGIPVLTTAFEGHEISIIPGVTGLIAKENDSQDIAKLIEWSISHPEETSEISIAARKHVLEIFNFERSIGDLYDILLKEVSRQGILKITQGQ